MPLSLPLWQCTTDIHRYSIMHLMPLNQHMQHRYKKCPSEIDYSKQTAQRKSRQPHIQPIFSRYQVIQNVMPVNMLMPNNFSIPQAELLIQSRRILVELLISFVKRKIKSRCAYCCYCNKVAGSFADSHRVEQQVMKD